ncbi:MAG: hypothetical protein ABDH21_06975 [bacterium]
MELDKIFDSILEFSKKQKFLPELYEAFSILFHRSKGTYKLVWYITAVCIMMIVMLISFVIFSLFNCLAVVNSLTNVNILTLVFFIISIFVVSVLITPFLHGYARMVSKDIFESLKSDLYDFLFFLHDFDENKKVYLLWAMILSFICVLLFCTSWLFSLGLSYWLSSFLPKVVVVYPLLSFLIRFLIISIVFSIVFPFIFTVLLVFVNNFGGSGIKHFKFVDIGLVITKSLKVYFMNFVKFLLIGFLCSIGLVSILGNLVTFPLGFLMVGISYKNTKS